MIDHLTISAENGTRDAMEDLGYRYYTGKSRYGTGNHKIDKVKGLGVNIVTTAKTDEEAKKLLEFLGMPFRK